MVVVSFCVFFIQRLIYLLIFDVRIIFQVITLSDVSFTLPLPALMPWSYIPQLSCLLVSRKVSQQEVQEMGEQERRVSASHSLPFPCYSTLGNIAGSGWDSVILDSPTLHGLTPDLL